MARLKCGMRFLVRDFDARLPQAVSLQRLERRSRRLFQRSGKFLQPMAGTRPVSAASLVAALSSDFSTCSLLSASACARASESPVCAFTAFSQSRNGCPVLKSIRSAWPSRLSQTQISRATSLVMRSSGDGP